jgi:hemerythrin-like domain-containing protein
MITDTHTHTSGCWWNPDQARWVCHSTPGPAPAATAAPEAPLVDVRDMVVVHTALLREFRLAPAAIERVDDGDRRRAAVVDRHVGFLCDLLHHHHAGEDELLWPLLRARLDAAGVRLLDAVEAQHADLDAALRTVAAQRAAWTQSADPTTRDALGGGVRRLHLLLAAHLELEERAVLPLAAAHLTEGEWGAVGEAAVAAMPKPALLLAFGMFAYEGDPAVLRAMLASAPALPRMLLPRVAPRVYARRALAVHGSARP